MKALGGVAYGCLADFVGVYLGVWIPLSVVVTIEGLASLIGVWGYHIGEPAICL